ncbi:CapA family protein [Oceanobacillus sp. CFH 90083]|uniref:CapA family protein n=1 Tax=Oceanobacillus sp. CFH 90083 TaxID=2592336 RepID=UPI00188324B4|nr:CapA family protein [Oceanobacillus sp. CFH 90083]
MNESRTKDIAVLTFSKNQLFAAKPQGNRISPWGTGHLLLYLSIILDLQEGVFSPSQTIVFSKRAASQKKALRSTKGDQEESRILLDVLNQAISLNAPDCILALCMLYGGEKKAQEKINKLGRELNISKNSRLNITGRLVKNQMSNLFDYYKIGMAFLNLARSSFNYIRNRPHVIKGEMYKPQSTLDLKGDTIASIFWGTTQNDCLIFREINNEICCSVVINGLSYIHTAEVALASSVLEKARIKQVSLESPIINILADTYFGEFYTEKRIKKNRTDALQKYGYEYTLEKLSEKFSTEDFNIVTYEGVLINPEEPCYNKRKVFYLGGDKKKTINEFKNRNIRLVNLGNNHAKDYGEEALADTVRAFNQANMATVGAGNDLIDAVKPVVLSYKNKKIAVFSGYWHRNGKDADFDFYATTREGVSSLDGLLLEEIETFKKDNPSVFTVVLAHWGVDFKNILPHQRKLAKLLVKKGADLIIGSGPHKVQPVEEIDGVKVFYSLGNGAFNSDGWDLKKEGNFPYGYFLKWDISENEILVYPFWNYNPDTFWQPRFIEGGEQEEVLKDISTINSHQLLENPTTDAEGHLYYSIKADPVKKKPIENWKEWFTRNLQGEFLEPDLVPSLEFDFATIYPERMKQSDCQQALVVSLAAENLKSMYNDASWNPKHRNEILAYADYLEKIALIVTDSPIESLRKTVPQFIVENSLQAASFLADFMVENYKGKMVTITGSVGKSSTRMLLEQLFEEEEQVSNRGNSNLHLANLELALNLIKQPEKAFFEIAIGGLNALAYGNEASRYRSDVAIMSSYGIAHAMWGVDSNLSRKAELFFCTKDGGTAIINGDIEEKYLWKILKQARLQNLNIKMYSLVDEKAFCYLIHKKVRRDNVEVSISFNGSEISIPLKVGSNGQVQNIMSALIVLDDLGYDITEYIHKFWDYRNLPRNLEEIEIITESNYFTVIDDTHNSSVPALKNGLQYFKEKKNFYKGNKLLVVGEVAELGLYSLEEHQKLKVDLEKTEATQIFLWGDSFKQVSEELANAQWFANKDEIITAVKNHMNHDTLIFIKGSSYSKFYTVADQIRTLK